MIKGEYDYLKALAAINECAEHGMPLVVATHPSDATYVLRCGEGEYPDVIRHIPSLTEELKQGTLAEGPIANNIRRREKMRKWLIISSVVVVLLCILLVSGGYAFAASSVDGFNESLTALLDGLKAYFKAVIDLFTIIF